jgi:hypothetical protein
MRILKEKNMKSKTWMSAFFLMATIGCPFASVFAVDSPAIERTRAAILMHQNKGGPSNSPSSATSVIDVGNIAVMTGDRTTFIPAIPFDLQSKSISFTPNSTRGYDVKSSSNNSTVKDGPVRVPYGSHWIAFSAGFSFPFYGKSYTGVFVNTRGGLTFGSADSSGPDLIPYLSGPPRITALIQEYEAYAEVTMSKSATKFSTTWKVNGYYTGITEIFQINLFSSGKIEVLFGDAAGDPEDEFGQGIVGITPGGLGTKDLVLVHYSKITTMKITGPKAIFQRFSNSASPDFVAILHQFRETHPSDFDFVVIFTDQPYGSVPEESLYSVQNSVGGTGLTKFDDSATFASPKLLGFISMGDLAHFPANPQERFKNTYNTSQLLGNLHGHQWMPPACPITGGQGPDIWLVVNGALGLSWSFFLETNGSVMGGNSIRDNGDGSFTTLGATRRYSQLDQYFMGLIPLSQVQPFFLVSNDGDASALPTEGATFSGTKRKITINNIVRSNRIPKSEHSQKQFREAFLYFVAPGSKASSGQIAKIDKIRKAWESFFASASNHKGSIDTSLTK